MIKKIITLLLVSYLLLLYGCSSVQMASKDEDLALKNFTLPPSSKAGLYIYRNSLAGVFVMREIYVDSVFIGVTANQVYFFLELSPGTHIISTQSEFGENALTFEAEGGKNYFVEQYIKMGVFSGGSNVEMVSEEVGKEQVLKCELAAKQEK